MSQYASSSISTTQVRKSKPGPPYSFGKATVRSPSFDAFLSMSHGKSCKRFSDRSSFSAMGRISLSAKSLAIFCKAFCSSVKSKSIMSASAFFGTDPASRSITESKDSTVLSREPVHHRSLILRHVQDFPSFEKVIGGGPGNEGGSLTGVLFPDDLGLGGHKEGCEKIPSIRMARAFEQADL